MKLINFWNDNKDWLKEDGILDISKVDNNEPKVLIYNSLGELLDDLITYREVKEDNDIE